MVGIHKFQYDIWGDTVNTASRMQTNGVIGKVNIGESTYNFIKETSGPSTKYLGQPHQI